MGAMAMVIQKSSQKSTPNLPKYYSYRMAWGRIKTAMEQEFYLEVVTIAEGIISDRLTSQIYQCGQSPPKKDRFIDLIKIWENSLTEELSTHHEDLLNDGKNLIAEIDAWREKRNRIVHGIVKGKNSKYASQRHIGRNNLSENNQPNIEDFLEEARRSAEQGKALARKICAWDRKLSKFRKLSQTPTRSSC